MHPHSRATSKRSTGMRTRPLLAAVANVRWSRRGGFSRASRKPVTALETSPKSCMLLQRPVEAALRTSWDPDTSAGNLLIHHFVSRRCRRKASAGSCVSLSFFYAAAVGSKIQSCETPHKTHCKPQAHGGDMRLKHPAASPSTDDFDCQQ